MAKSRLTLDNIFVNEEYVYTLEEMDNDYHECVIDFDFEGTQSRGAEEFESEYGYSGLIYSTGDKLEKLFVNRLELLEKNIDKGELPDYKFDLMLEDKTINDLSVKDFFKDYFFNGLFEKLKDEY